MSAVLVVAAYAPATTAVMAGLGFIVIPLAARRRADRVAAAARVDAVARGVHVGIVRSPLGRRPVSGIEVVARWWAPPPVLIGRPPDTGDLRCAVCHRPILAGLLHYCPRTSTYHYPERTVAA